jgi:hypothetical protein
MLEAVQGFQPALKIWKQGENNELGDHKSGRM